MSITSQKMCYTINGFNKITKSRLFIFQFLQGLNMYLSWQRIHQYNYVDVKTLYRHKENEDIKNKKSTSNTFIIVS